TFLCKVASVHYQQNLYNEAISLWQTALEGLQRIDGNGHEVTQIKLTVTANIANTYNTLGQYDRALHYYNELLWQREERLGWKDSSVLDVMHRIATIFVRQDK